MFNLITNEMIGFSSLDNYTNLTITMNDFLLKEVKKFKKRKVIQSIRILLDVFACLLIYQWLYSGVSSILASGKLKVLWIDDWIYNVAPIIWLVIIVVLLFLSSQTNNQN